MNFITKRGLNLANDMINVFTDYSYSLDNYFKDEKNRTEHSELYEEYLILNKNLKSIMKKNGFDK